MSKKVKEKHFQIVKKKKVPLGKKYTHLRWLGKGIVLILEFQAHGFW